MSTRSPKKTIKKLERATNFSCHAPEADEVFVAGTFNDWNPTASPLRRAGGGNWTAVVNLPPGRYEFKFIVNGQWCCAPGGHCHHCDHACPDCVSNDCGSMNRVLIVA